MDGQQQQLSAPDIWTRVIETKDENWLRALIATLAGSIAFNAPDFPWALGIILAKARWSEWRQVKEGVKEAAIQLIEIVDLQTYHSLPKEVASAQLGFNDEDLQGFPPCWWVVAGANHGGTDRLLGHRDVAHGTTIDQAIVLLRQPKGEQSRPIHVIHEEFRGAEGGGWLKTLVLYINVP